MHCPHYKPRMITKFYLLPGLPVCLFCSSIPEIIAPSRAAVRLVDHNASQFSCLQVGRSSG